MQIKEIINYLDQEIPPSLAESWDNVGLLIGDQEREITGVLIALDLSFDLIAQAKKNKANLIITHHPLIFAPLKRICKDNPQGAMLLDLIEAKIAVFSLHTNYDQVPGFMNSILAKKLGQELELEIIDLLWQNPAQEGYGYGAILDLAETIKLSSLIPKLKMAYACPFVQAVAYEDKEIKRIATMPGSFAGEWIDLLAKAQVDCLICGETKHHVNLDLASRNIASISIGHDLSERIGMPKLRDHLASKFPQISFDLALEINYNKLYSE